MFTLQPVSCIVRATFKDSLNMRESERAQIDKSYPMRVDNSDGETVALCMEFETAIAILCGSGQDATLWLGVSNPQKIYTLVEDDASVGSWYGGWSGDFASELEEASWVVARNLYPQWDSLAQIYESEKEFIEIGWWKRFHEFIIMNGGDEVRLRAGDEEFIELLNRSVIRDKDNHQYPDMRDLRNIIRDEQGSIHSGDMPTLPSLDSL